MDSLLRGASKFINEYMGEALVKVLLILSMDSLLKEGVAKFVNGYISEAKFKKMLIQQWKSQRKKAVNYETK